MHMPSCRSAAEVPASDTLVARYREQLRSGDAEAAGGSSDPAVRLDHLLKVGSLSKRKRKSVSVLVSNKKHVATRLQAA